MLSFFAFQKENSKSSYIIFIAFKFGYINNIQILLDIMRKLIITNINNFYNCLILKRKN